MRGLTIREPWIGMILSGEKTWEIRTQNTQIRERIGLVRSGAPLVVGYATLTSVRVMTRQQLAEHFKRHRVPQELLEQYGKPTKPLYAWILEDVVELTDPVPFTRPKGAVNWVQIPNN